MKARIRIGVMILIVLSIYSNAVLADSIPGGGDAGNTLGEASPIYPSILLNQWGYYSGYLSTADLVDWYRLNTQAGESLGYTLDSADIYTTKLEIFDSLGNKIGFNNSGEVRVSGTTYARVSLISGTNVYYQFALRRS